MYMAVQSLPRPPGTWTPLSSDQRYSFSLCIPLLVNIRCFSLQVFLRLFSQYFLISILLSLFTFLGFNIFIIFPFFFFILKLLFVTDFPQFSSSLYSFYFFSCLSQIPLYLLTYIFPSIDSPDFSLNIFFPLRLLFSYFPLYCLILSLSFDICSFLSLPLVWNQVRLKW